MSRNAPRHMGLAPFVGALVFALSGSANAETNNWTYCAEENQTCWFSGQPKVVRYGESGRYVQGLFWDNAPCAPVLGDPFPGTWKRCYMSDPLWVPCAKENGTCNIPGQTTLVRYGANGTFWYQWATNSHPCNNTQFSGDPVPGVVKTCEAAVSPNSPASPYWGWCASEGGTCSLPGTHLVRYGALGSYFYKMMTGSISCSYLEFGDSNYGINKTCEVMLNYTGNANGWGFCSNEGYWCNTPSSDGAPKMVRFGANGKYFDKFVDFTSSTDYGRTRCGVAAWGDPIPGVRKHCDTSEPAWILDATRNQFYFRPANSGIRKCTGSTCNYVKTLNAGDHFCDADSCSHPYVPSGFWQYCSGDGGVCNFTGKRTVRYGGNGSFFYQVLTGPVPCNLSAFGDANWGYGKYCEVEMSTPPADTNQCGTTHTWAEKLTKKNENWGNTSIGSSYTMMAGLGSKASTGYDAWVGAQANSNVTLFTKSSKIFDLKAIGTLSGTTSTTQLYVEAVGQTIVNQSTSGAYNYPYTRTFLDASATFSGVTVSGSAVGTVGISGEGSFGPFGVTMTGTPTANVSATASASVGAGCMNVGASANVTLIDIAVPTMGNVAYSGGKIAWGCNSALQLASLNGGLSLDINACFWSHNQPIFSWNGYSYDRTLLDESGCL